MVRFSMPNSIFMSLTVYYDFFFLLEFPILFLFLANSLMSFMYIRWFIFSCDLLTLYPAVHFLGKWLSGIMAIMNSNSDSTSSRNISLCIFASAKLFSSAINSTFQVLIVFLDKVYDFVWYFVHFETVYHPALWYPIICLFVVKPGHFCAWSCSC